MNKRFAPDCAQKSMLEFVPKSSVKTTVTVSKTDFKASIMKMVAYDGVALSFFVLKYQRKGGLVMDCNTVFVVPGSGSESKFSQFRVRVRFRQKKFRGSGFEFGSSQNFAVPPVPR